MSGDFGEYPMSDSITPRVYLVGQMLAADNFYAVGADRDFIIFNDGPLGWDSIGPEDLEPIEVPPGTRESLAWSANVRWYFIFTPIGIALLNVDTHKGILCRTMSACFIQAFLDAPLARKKRERQL